MQRRGHHGLSDRGRVRAVNEDKWHADPRRGLYLVADGMGGQGNGELAASVVVQSLPAAIQQSRLDEMDLASPEASETLARIFAENSAALHDETQRAMGLRGTGSTVVLALIGDGKALIGHMGDSRCYLFRDGALSCLTRDHSLVQLLIDSGDIQVAEAATHPSRGQLTRYMGMDGEALPEVRCVALRDADKLLLCTDGLTGMVSDSLIAEIIADTSSEMICQRLIDAANAAGGKDNVTALIVVGRQIELETTSRNPRPGAQGK